MHYRWTEGRWPQKGTKVAKAIISCAFFASLWLRSSVFHPAARSVSQLSRLIQLREAATTVNEKDFPSLIHPVAGTGMRNRRGRSAQETKLLQPIGGFHTRNVRGRTRELSAKCKINECRSWRTTCQLAASSARIPAISLSASPTRGDSKGSGHLRF